MIKKGIGCYPLKIKFESNENVSTKDVDQIISMYTDLGYKVISKGYDTLLEYQPRNDVHSF